MDKCILEGTILVGIITGVGTTIAEGILAELRVDSNLVAFEIVVVVVTGVDRTRLAEDSLPMRIAIEGTSMVAFRIEEPFVVEGRPCL